MLFLFNGARVFQPAALYSWRVRKPALRYLGTPFYFETISKPVRAVLSFSCFIIYLVFPLDITAQYGPSGKTATFIPFLKEDSNIFLTDFSMSF